MTHDPEFVAVDVLATTGSGFATAFATVIGGAFTGAGFAAFCSNFSVGRGLGKALPRLWGDFSSSIASTALTVSGPWPALPLCAPADLPWIQDI